MCMKKILLIGDSIRQGYDKQVRNTLAGQAEVYFPSDNCRFAEYVLRHFTDWVSASKFGVPDLIHWNAGLWDTLQLDDHEPLTPADVYEYFIQRIFKRMKNLYPNTIIIFATSTPVLEERYSANFRRFNADIRRYNEIAVRVAGEFGCDIDDLYAACNEIPESYYSDMTHLYTPEGTKLLTNKVLSSIIPPLGLKPVTYVGDDTVRNEVSGI
jgi:lysophospholipase L1-like esterase